MSCELERMRAVDRVGIPIPSLRAADDECAGVRRPVPFHIAAVAQMRRPPVCDPRHRTYLIGVVLRDRHDGHVRVRWRVCVRDGARGRVPANARRRHLSPLRYCRLERFRCRLSRCRGRGCGGGNRCRVNDRAGRVGGTGGSRHAVGYRNRHNSRRRFRHSVNKNRLNTVRINPVRVDKSRLRRGPGRRGCVGQQRGGRGSTVEGPGFWASLQRRSVMDARGVVSVLGTYLAEGCAGRCFSASTNDVLNNPVDPLISLRACLRRGLCSESCSGVITGRAEHRSNGSSMIAVRRCG